jgi:UDP-N-acetylmuramoyl-tripeptide--D-alanyl-D-alanine ligase
VIPLELNVLEPLGRVLTRPWTDVVTGMQIDSRRIEEGDLFVAVGDGTDFIEHAIARGAGAVLVPTDPVPALAAIAGEVRSRSRARVVGITGSTGKTSTKDILFALCAPHRRTIANEGNYNTEFGVPLTICRIEEDTEICISELGMRGLGQIAWLASFARPDVGVITNVGPVHLELVETIENVARAKAELIDALAPGGVLVIPDEPLLEPYLTRSDIFVKRVDVDAPLPFTTNYSSRHQLANTRTAIAVAECLDVPLPDGALRVEFSKLREEEQPLPGGGLLLNDCYNANPVSMRAALLHLAERGAGHRRVAVLGEMAELGAGAPGYHAEVGALLAELGIEQVIAVGELARAYGGDWVATASDAADKLRVDLRPGDVVLVKGSRSVGLEAVAENLAIEA